MEKEKVLKMHIDKKKIISNLVGERFLLVYPTDESGTVFELMASKIQLNELKIISEILTKIVESNERNSPKDN